MAVYGDFSSSFDYSSVTPNISHIADEGSILSWYSTGLSPQPFPGGKGFQRSCMAREQDVREGSANEYLVFTGVTDLDIVTTDKVRKSLPKMVCLYDAEEEILVAKLMVGLGHEAASLRLLTTLMYKLNALGLDDEIAMLGSSRFGDNRRSKEADQAFKPMGTRATDDAWPTLVFEVGLSESMGQLRNDARFWLTHSNLQTNIVLCIHINRAGRQMEVERWEVTAPQRAHRTVAHYPPTISCVQRVLLGAGIIYTGPPLQLLVAKVFDIVPPGLAVGALDLTAAELQSWNDSFWRVFH